MKINLNQIFSTKNTLDYIRWEDLTKGRFKKPLNLYKGMPYFKEIRGIVPLINFHTNPCKEDETDSPWRDLVFQEEGRVVYNGDNYQSTKMAAETFGNKKVLSVLNLYYSKLESERIKAPPIIVTRTKKINNSTGYREFIGYGLITVSPKLVQQYEKKSNDIFSNYQFEVTLLKLHDGEKFDWKWIDDRRDNNISLADSLSKAPKSWQEWVKHGSNALNTNRLRIKSYRKVSIKEQSKMPDKNKKLIKELLEKHYPNPTIDGIRFEALASFITELYFEGRQYYRGWITVGSSDRGVDFVGRLDIGADDFSKTSLIVLGQSKRYNSSISGEKLTRVASRMTRGYIGVVITLDTFTTAAQAEIKDDKLPIILINGKKVSELLLNYMNYSGKSLAKIVKEQDEWAQSNIGSEHYDSILIY